MSEIYNEELAKSNEELLKKVQAEQNQVLIEDGTMSSFGFNNPSEVKVKSSDLRK